jgi:hypothetical protein
MRRLAFGGRSVVGL